MTTVKAAETVRLIGQPKLPGEGAGAALVTRQPINFTAALTKIANVLPGKRAELRDAHHPLFGKSIAGKVLVFPSCIGSTHTGLVLLDLVSKGRGPAALIVQHCDSLLVSGIVLSDVWYGRRIPIVEYGDADLFETITDGDHVAVDGTTGEIVVTKASAKIGRSADVRQ
jgi:predicted aconitase with swiveling domain